MSIPAGLFMCPMCRQHVETLLPTSSEPVCNSRSHLKPAKMERVVPTLLQRQRRQRKRAIRE